MTIENILHNSSSRRCPECGSTRIMEDSKSAEIVCICCGYVIVTELTNQGPEWNAFDSEQHEKRARVGSPGTFTIHDKGLSTTIDWNDKDIHGQTFPHGQRAQIYRLRNWQRRIRISDATERNLVFALSEISKMANNLNLPKNIIETASVVYRKAVKERLIRGRSIQGVTAAAIYVACRQCGLARSMEEIVQVSPASKKEVGRSYRFLSNKLNYFIPPIKTSQYIAKFSNRLSFDGKTEDISHKIFLGAKELKLTSGRSPAGVAAASVYIASILSGNGRTQNEVSEIAQVTEVTIRNRYKELLERLQLIIYL